MKPSRPSLLLILLLAATPAAASPAEAGRIEKGYQLSLEKWALEVRIANTPEARTEAFQKRPDPAVAAREMWKAISLSLREDWTIEPAAWFLATTAGITTPTPDGGTTPTFASETEMILEAIAAHHLGSPKLAPLCMALVASGDPRSLALLEKIENGHPDTKIQGVAALGVAMILKTLGDDPEIMRKRLTLLRKAIIESADTETDGVSVAKLAEDELYVIRFLTKGRVAPDLSGADSGGRQLTLSAHEGNVIILLFWNSGMEETDRVIEITSGLEDKFRGRPVTVIGVNNDSTENLRFLQADGTVNWINFSDPHNRLAAEYRVGRWPLVYVLDHKRRIHYAGPPGAFVELTAEALIEDIAKQDGK